MFHQYLSLTLTAFIGFFAVINPLATAPVFLGVVGDAPRPLRNKIANHSIVIGFVIVAVFCVLGQLIFSLFGLSLPAFRIIGGGLIVMCGFQLLNGHDETTKVPDTADINNSALSIALFPLATPVIGGPGSIAVAMSYSADQGLQGVLTSIIACGLACFVTWIVFRFSAEVVNFMGRGAIKLISRMMGLILAVMGMQMLIIGIHGAIIMFSKLPV